MKLDAGNSGDWRLTGNAGTSPSTHFLGTTDAVNLSLRTNGTERIRVSSSGNVRLNAYTTNNVVKTSGGDGTLTVGAVNLASSEVTGILPIAKGGTNTSATPTAGGVAYGTGTAFAFTPAGTGYYVFIHHLVQHNGLYIGKVSAFIKNNRYCRML